MRLILEKSNLDALRELGITRGMIANKQVPLELSLYKKWLMEFLVELETEIHKTLYYISLNKPSIYPDLLNNTQIITRNLRVFNETYLPPLYRYQPGDNLCIKLLYWLHSQHSQTKQKPFAVSDGAFQIRASTNGPMIYYLPSATQQSLLYLPLFFHEIGHFFYDYHKPEMDALVKDFQNSLDDHLIPAFQQNNQAHIQHQDKIRSIIETWYGWMQEMFCDAVGLLIGGSSYLHAFSLYLRTSGRDAFYRPEKYLAGSSHPVTWLRIKLLINRASNMNLEDDIEYVKQEWIKTANLLGIREEYFGYYTNQYEEDLVRTIDLMLEEASPIEFISFNQIVTEFDPGKHNYVQLLTFAWQKYLKHPEKYSDWEKYILSQL